MNNRIIGFDVARALAIFGMVIVNFKIAMNAETGNEFLLGFTYLFEGRSSALFVVLAGIGITLLTKKNVATGDVNLINKSRISIIKRGILLILIGLSYATIWEADILHYYGFYFILAAFFITSKNRALLIASVIVMLTFPVLMFFLDYNKGWNWLDYSYRDFWTITGMVRHIFFNGFHPIFPWFTFLLFGMWLGRQNLNLVRVQKKLVIISVSIIILIELVLSYLRHNLLQIEGSDSSLQEILLLLSTTIIPPLPTYIMVAGSTASVVIVFSVILCNYYKDTKLVQWLAKTGQLSLTLYVAHVILGMGLLDVTIGLEEHSINFSLLYTLLFCSLAMVFSVFWINRYNIGPLEMIFRKIIK